VREGNPREWRIKFLWKREEGSVTRGFARLFLKANFNFTTRFPTNLRARITYFHALFSVSHFPLLIKNIFISKNYSFIHSHCVLPKMNIEQLELQMDSVIYSLRERFRRPSASSPSSSIGHQSTQIGPDSLRSSAAPSPISRRGGRTSSLRSRGSLRKLRKKLFGEGSGTSSQRGEGADARSLVSLWKKQLIKHQI
jgi:hypothetical protein